MQKITNEDIIVSVCVLNSVYIYMWICGHIFIETKTSEVSG